MTGPTDLASLEAIADRLALFDRQELKLAALELRVLRRFVERMALCPDHRDKSTGRCIVCDGERRGRDAEQDRLGGTL